MKPGSVLLAFTAIAAAACGDDSGPGDASPSPTEAEGSPTATAPSTVTPNDQPVEGVRDLAVDSPQAVVYGKATDDLRSGASNVALGDFNADDEPDLLVGAPQADGAGREDAGEAYVIFGPLEGEIDLLSEDPDIIIYGQSAGDALGFSVFAGDLNDDGVDEVMVGAPGVTAGFDPRTDQGRVYVFYGSETLSNVTEFDLIEDVYDLTVTGSEGFSRLSTDLDLGDINGDGRTDLVVSSPFAGRAPGTPPGSERTAEGEVYVIFGEESALMGEYNMAAGDYDILLGGTQEFGQFGAAFAVGNFNGDDFDDVAVGAYRNDATDGRPSAGEAYVFFGSSDISGRLSGLDDAQDVSISGATSGSALGLPVAAGDFNGDGLDDFAIGAQSEGVDNLVTPGSLRVFYGRDDFPDEIDLSSEDADLTLVGTVSGALLPTAIIAGDPDGDGKADIIFSSALGGADAGRSSGGLIYVIRVSPELPDRISRDDLPEPMIGPTDGARLGATVWFGAISGDGTAGLATLATGVSPNAERSGAGAVYIVPMEVQ